MSIKNENIVNVAKELALPFISSLQFVDVKVNETQNRVNYDKSNRSIEIPDSPYLDDTISSLLVGGIAYENEWDIDNMPSVIGKLTHDIGDLLKKMHDSEEKTSYMFEIDEKDKFRFPLTMVDMLKERNVQIVVFGDRVEIHTDNAILVKEGATSISSRVVTRSVFMLYQTGEFVGKLPARLLKLKEDLVGEYKVFWTKM